jgi:hypothetical protein
VRASAAEVDTGGGDGDGGADGAAAPATPGVTLADPELAKTAPDKDPHRGKGGVKVWTAAELAKHNGSDAALPLMLVVMGQVFDVTRGKEHYGEGSGYHIFVGQDASRAFVSGEFEENKPGGHDATGMKESEMMGVDDWRRFYHNEEYNGVKGSIKYPFQGYLTMPDGYYNDEGRPTPKLLAIEAALEKAYSRKKELEEFKKTYPTCNSRYEQGKGSWVWCDEGKVPRTGRMDWDNGERCACYEPAFAGKHAARLTVYKDCAPEAAKCTLTRH